MFKPKCLARSGAALLTTLTAPRAPRTGTSTPLGSFKGQSRQTFDPPGGEAPGNDWILLFRNETP